MVVEFKEVNKEGREEEGGQSEELLREWRERERREREERERREGEVSMQLKLVDHCNLYPVVICI